MLQFIGDGVNVGVNVCVSSGLMSVGTSVSVISGQGLNVAVLVGVRVKVGVRVLVGVLVSVGVRVSEAVLVGLGVAVELAA